MYSAPVETGKVQGQVWKDTRRQKFYTPGSGEDKKNTIVTHRYEKTLDDERFIRVIAVSYSPFKRTIDVRVEVN